jgi:hypothetical protein
MMAGGVRRRLAWEDSFGRASPIGGGEPSSHGRERATERPWTGEFDLVRVGLETEKKMVHALGGNLE